MKRKIFTYSCRYYDKKGDLRNQIIQISSEKEVEFGEVINSLCQECKPAKIVNISLMSEENEILPELVWVLCESLVSKTPPYWIPAYKYDNGRILSINGELITPKEEPDKYIKPFTECPYDGYKITKIK